MKAFYFAHKGNRLNYRDNRLVRVGITHTVDCKPELCYRGLHGSKRIIDALNYADYHILYRVEIKGDIDEGDDKLCGTSRKYIQRFDMEDILFEFSRWVAKQNIKKIKPYTNKEDYALIIKWLDTGDQSIKSAARSAAESAARSARSAAESAARSAAWSAAESAAESAARSAAGSAARSAAWSAAGSARSAAESAAWSARSAAGSAARSAAWSAAGSAARSAAESAARSARSAAESAQERKLRQMVKAKYGEIA